MTAELKFRLIVEDAGGKSPGAWMSKEQAYSAKRTRVAYIKGHGYQFEGSTGLWVLYDGDGWDRWQGVLVEDSAGNHWCVGDEPDVKGLPPIEALGVTMEISRLAEYPAGAINHWPAGARHYLVRLARGEEAMGCYYSAFAPSGPEPTLLDILERLVDNWIGSEVQFTEWCKELNLAPTNPALATFRLLQSESASLMRLFPDFSMEDMFSIVHRWEEPQGLAADPDGENAKRAERAAAALVDYLEQDDPPTAVMALLVDLMHYSRANNIDFAAQFERAVEHYTDETTLEEI